MQKRGRGQITIAKLHGPLNATLINSVKTMTPSYRPADTLRPFDDVKGSRVARVAISFNACVTFHDEITLQIKRCHTARAPMQHTRHDRSNDFPSCVASLCLRDVCFRDDGDGFRVICFCPFHSRMTMNIYWIIHYDRFYKGEHLFRS